MKKLLSVLLILGLTGSGATLSRTKAQEPAQTKSAKLTNQDVLDMAKSGLSTDIIVAKIKSTPAQFDTTPETLLQLRASGLADPVILAMVQAAENPRPTTSVAADASGVAEVKVADGTEVEIELKNTASGEELKVGDIVDFSVVRPVVLNGVTVFDKDASARARITTAQRAGHWGHAGKLEWAMQDVRSVEGGRVPARFTKREIGDSKGGTVAVAAVATTVLLGPLGLLWGLKRGKPAIIPAGNRYTVFVHGEATVKGKAAATVSMLQE